MSGGLLRWPGVELLTEPRGRGMTKQVLFAGADVDVRYFELEPSGWTPLEHHGHTHRVMVLRGRGACLVEDTVRPLAPQDLVFVPSWAWHQFRAAADAPLGFLCIVPAERDAGLAPGPADLVRLRASPAVADFLSS